MADALLEQLIAGFVEEAKGLAAKATRQLLELEKSGGGRSFDDLARGLHTLKGSAATLGLSDLSELAHKMEDALLPLRGHEGPLPGRLADTLLKALDAFLSHLQYRAGLGGEQVDLIAVHRVLERAAEEAEQEAARPGAPPQRQTPVPPIVTSQPPAKGQPSQPALHANGSSKPPSEEPSSDDEGWRVGARQVVGILSEVERLRELRLRLDERRRELDRTVQQLARLGIQGQTVETRALLMGVSRQLAADGEQAGDIVAALEEGLKAITTLPVRTVLEPLHRAVRDLCRQAGKEGRLSVVGGEVSLDRRVLDALRGPLVQLVRNAVDHGLEDPAERERRGKHREGSITIRVEQQGNILFLEVADDGGGLDLARIREAAVRAGLYTPEQAAVLPVHELMQLIFRAGLSTRAEASELSGRGVGLDVVRAQLQQLQGQVEVQSTQGQGTRFLLSLPAVLGSSPILVVRVGEHTLGVPMAAIESSRAVIATELKLGRNRVQLEYRERLVPVQELGALLGLRQPEPPLEGRPLLIVQLHGQRVAIAVDEVLGDRELFVRPLPSEVRELPAWQGAATLARGELVLILRPDWLIQPERAVEPVTAAVRRALVVDDSLTARALHRTALEAGGFVVHTASSGEVALEQLKHNTYQVLVADIGMDEMDGFALTRTVRGLPGSAATPIVLVSARDSEADRAEGLAAGADGYLSKKECASGRLLTEVAGVIARRRGGVA
ncbi:MAG: response regulator [Deltaproteobacteria bacterium]|nr:response regulator [Deltaproteobacteria bacterium]